MAPRGVTGARFVPVAATLVIVSDIPIQAPAILVGIDKFMSECRALTNLIGNKVATIVIRLIEGELDGKSNLLRSSFSLGAAVFRLVTQNDSCATPMPLHISIIDKVAQFRQPAPRRTDTLLSAMRNCPRAGSVAHET
jgi:hypothetical protein